MFYGEYQHNLDAKGRVIMPAKFRDGLGEKFMLTRGLDNCLFAFSVEEWAVLEAKVKDLPLADQDVRAFTRFFFGGACECDIDKQGRIMIPGYLRTYAQLEKELYVMGVSSRVEIWSKNSWEEYTMSESSTPEKFAEKMAMLGI